MSRPENITGAEVSKNGFPTIVVRYDEGNCKLVNEKGDTLSRVRIFVSLSR